MTWSLYEEGKFLEPLRFSNGKTQEDVVKEVLKEIEKGKKIIFIKGICGTGKSAIALHLAKELGKSSIVVPGKTLQNQYKRDYEEKKYILNGKEKLKISVITGRNNHKCKFLEDNESAIPKFVREMNSSLQDIFEGRENDLRDLIGRDKSAENLNIPCKIEIKEKNFRRIQKYLQQNKKSLSEFIDIKDVKRMSFAPVCPYWSPVIPDRYEIKVDNAKKKEYEGIGGKCIFYERKKGCSFYEQFDSYLNSDAIVFNSFKYKFESNLGRKPVTEVEIIDECDEFLDSFANQRNLNIDRLGNAIGFILSSEKNHEKILREIIEIIKQIKINKRILNSVRTNEIIPLKETGVYDLMKIYLDNQDFLENIDEESYVFEVQEIIRAFDEFLNETFLTASKKDDNLIVSLVTTNLEKKFKEMIEKNKLIVLMSGTLHSEEVLKQIFGLQEFVIVEAETGQQGNIEVVRTGLEKDCKYSNFRAGNHQREDYLLALNKCVKVAKKPALIHVNAFSDLPNDEEKKLLKLNELVSQEELKERQKNDKEGEDIKSFKKGEVDVLFSTKASRGIDFPGEQCNSIVFTKYPNPNVQDAFWKILMQTKPMYYWSFYCDKAKRELWQKVYRGLRFKDDHVYVLSPDSRVLDVFDEKKV